MILLISKEILKEESSSCCEIGYYHLIFLFEAKIEELLSYLALTCRRAYFRKVRYKNKKRHILGHLEKPLKIMQI